MPVGAIGPHYATLTEAVTRWGVSAGKGKTNEQAEEDWLAEWDYLADKVIRTLEWSQASYLAVGKAERLFIHQWQTLAAQYDRGRLVRITRDLDKRAAEHEQKAKQDQGAWFGLTHAYNLTNTGLTKSNALSVIPTTIAPALVNIVEEPKIAPDWTATAAMKATPSSLLTPTLSTLTLSRRSTGSPAASTSPAAATSPNASTDQSHSLLVPVLAGGAAAALLAVALAPGLPIVAAAGVATAGGLWLYGRTKR